MNVSDGRFKVNALIQLAKTTTNNNRRERYVAEAESILRIMEDIDISSMESFFTKRCIINQYSRMNRVDAYKYYVEFCINENMEIFSRNAFYYFLRENDVPECRGKSERYFKMKILNNS